MSDLLKRLDAEPKYTEPNWQTCMAERAAQGWFDSITIKPE